MDDDEADEGTEAPRAARDLPLPSLSVPQDALSADPARDPDLLKKEVKLGKAEQCAAREHERRIRKALRGIESAGPQQVGAALRRLGYDDAAMDGPRRAGDSVRFLLDLRFMGAQLCLGGDVSADRIAFDPYGGAPEVACADVRRTG
ncbi:hypothetical protein [Streptomyces sp. NPDC052225]|uniref:hypothetical protein n=1 Tax=Streptomyces sp. NPDC052225 TaxID=3154949 RepID=UPI00343158BC